MQIMKNRTILEGKVVRVEPASDGWGADVEVFVEKSAPAKGFSDFLQAAPGTSVKVFAAEPGALVAGKDYTFTTSVLGGPTGERTVIENARAKK